MFFNKKNSFLFSVPRAIYYMSFFTPLYSIFQIFILRKNSASVQKFESAFAKSVGCSFATATSHARICLYHSLRSLELEEQSEILVSPINLPDMINMIHLCKLRPVLFDYQKSNFNFSIEDLEKLITTKTKAMFLTTLNGICTNLEEVYAFAKKHNLIIIQDLTQSFQLLINNLDIATYSDISLYSLCDLKDVHTHRGGIIVTNNIKLLEKIKNFVSAKEKIPSKSYFFKFILEDFISLILLNRFFFSFFIKPIINLIYFLNLNTQLTNLTKGHGFKILGLNLGRGLWGGDGDYIRQSIPDFLLYKFTHLQAEIGLARLNLVSEISRRRKENALQLINTIPAGLLCFSHKEGNVYWKFPIKVSNVEKWQKYLLLHGIDASTTNLPYLTTLINFDKLVKKTNSLNGLFLTTNILYIPCHYYLESDEVDKLSVIVTQAYIEIEGS